MCNLKCSLSLFILSCLFSLPVQVSADTTVTVSTFVAQASEQGPGPGLFRLTRTGDTSSVLTVEFSLDGSATKGADYLLWENQAIFAPGNAECLITVLPRNDSLDEGEETITLLLKPGSGYQIGVENEAEVIIQDAFVSGALGVWTPQNLDPQTGIPLVKPDLIYIDAMIDNGFLNITVGITTPFGSNNIVVFLDTDQNPNTGDYRAGHVAGQEFRIDAATGFSSSYQLYKLRTVPPVNPISENPEDDFFITSGTPILNGNYLFISIPLSAIGFPAAVDVFASTHIASSDLKHVGVGDRAPHFGAIDTSVRQVVVKNPGITQSVFLTDPNGDAVNGFDFIGAQFDTIAGQFFFTLYYNQFFDPSQFQTIAPKGEIRVDSDQSLLTGSFRMDGAIPTHGGDVQIFYDMGSQFTVAPSVKVQTSTGGNQVPLGDTKNDGRWTSGGNSLTIAGSLSILDAFMRRTLPDGRLFPFRVPTNGQMYLQSWTIQGNFGEVADALHEFDEVIDLVNGQTLAPFVWDPLRTQIFEDFVEYPPPPISGQDIIIVETMVVDEHLVIKGTLTNLLSTDTGGLFEIALDTDMNVLTAPLGVLTNQQNGGPAIGVDYYVRVNGAETLSGAVYVAGIEYPDGSKSRNDAMVRVNATSSAGLPGSFIITIPLVLFEGHGPQLRFYVTTGRIDGAGLLDVAPPEPILIPLGSGLANIKIELTQGFNLFSYPVAIPAEINGCLDLIAKLGSAQEIRFIKRFNSNTQSFEQCNHAGESDFEIIAGESYIVNSLTNKELEITGVPICSTIALLQGLNFIGYQGTNNSSCFEWLNSINGALLLQRFNSDTGRLESCVQDNLTGAPVNHGVDFPVVAGEGYILHTKNEGTYLLPECN